MNHDPVFTHFRPSDVVADGVSVYDFLGVKTDTRFKKAWAQFAPPAGKAVQTRLPPVNEHYPDWVLTLESVLRARGIYRVAELGAGWGTWSSIAAAAARTRPQISGVEVVAMEADPTHHKWLQQHFVANGLKTDSVHLVHGAISKERGQVRFPVVENPDEDYGASLRQVNEGSEFILVNSFILEDVVSKFTGAINFMHIDIQGAEYDVIPDNMDLLKRSVKSIMIGTHLSLQHHEGMRDRFLDHGWCERMNYPRMASCDTPYGKIQFGDGVLGFENPDFS